MSHPPSESWCATTQLTAAEGSTWGPVSGLQRWFVELRKITVSASQLVSARDNPAPPFPPAVFQHSSVQQAAMILSSLQCSKSGSNSLRRNQGTIYSLDAAPLSSSGSGCNLRTPAEQQGLALQCSAEQATPSCTDDSEPCTPRALQLACAAAVQDLHVYHTVPAAAAVWLNNPCAAPLCGMLCSVQHKTTSAAVEQH